MQPSSEIIISDTSCLILLSKIEELDLLNKLSNKVYITSVILQEFGKDLPSWIMVKEPSDNHYQKILEMDLDRGEASAIALSLELDNSIIIIDDLKGRIIAERLNLRYSGTFGLILKAKQLGIIQSVKPILTKVKNTNFRFNEKLFRLVIEQAGEQTTSA
jgi:predicted nucleic acid-binding protein